MHEEATSNEESWLQKEKKKKKKRKGACFLPLVLPDKASLTPQGKRKERKESKKEEKNNN
jgi:hypothetical protein